MRFLPALVVVALGCGGCGGRASHPPDAAPRADALTIPDAAVIDATPPVRCLAPGADAGAPGRAKIYLVFDGVSLGAALFDDAVMNLSRSLAMNADIPPYRAMDVDRDTQIAAIVATLRTILAPWDVEVVTVRPATPPYMMVTFGGDAVTLVGGPVDALTRTDCGGDTTNDVALVFDGAGPSPIDVANLAASLVARGVGVSPSAVAGDCTCTKDPACATGAPCAFGTSVATQPATRCNGAGATQDEQDLMGVAFGCAR